MTTSPIVIVGGGAGGLELAAKLGRQYGPSQVYLIDKDTDLDGVIDRFDSDFRDSDVMTSGDIDERIKDKSNTERPSILGQLKKNQEKSSEVGIQMKSKTDVDVCL